VNTVITIGRQFGSGGREFGKRLADELQIPYYDREIMEEIAKRTQLAEDYLNRVVEHRPSYHFPITVGRTLHGVAPDYMIRHQAEIFAEKNRALREMAERSDCVIVGRCADYILREMKPIRIFVYADMDSRIARCRARAEADEGLSDRQMKKRILEVDRNRARYYRYYTGQIWGDRSYYDLCINTTNTDIKAAAHAVAMMIRNQIEE